MSRAHATKRKGIPMMRLGIGLLVLASALPNHVTPSHVLSRLVLKVSDVHLGHAFPGRPLDPIDEYHAFYSRFGSQLPASNSEESLYCWPPAVARKMGWRGGLAQSIAGENTLRLCAYVLSSTKNAHVVYEEEVKPLSTGIKEGSGSRLALPSLGNERFGYQWHLGDTPLVIVFRRGTVVVEFSALLPIQNGYDAHEHVRVARLLDSRLKS